MKTTMIRLAVVCACLVPEAVFAQAAQNPYQALSQRVETRARFTTDIAFPGGPNFQIKVYDWLIGPRQEIANFPLEGFATIEVKSGELDATINGVTTRHREGEHFAVPEAARFDIKVGADTGRGDNIVSLHGVVAIRR